MRKETLKKEFSFLKTHPSTYKETKKNLVLFLKHLLPGVKFSIRKRDYSAIDIHHKGGSSFSEFKKAVKTFEPCGIHVTPDFWDYRSTAFNSLFGSFKFIFVHEN